MNKTKKTEPKLIAMPLSFTLPDCQTLCIAGTFNDWSPTATPLKRDGDQTWSCTLQLSPGKYEYRLVANGAWVDVPGATETVANNFGSTNAVLTVVAAAARTRKSAIAA